jgi:acyl dehydratase
MAQGLYYEQFEIGQTFKHPITRTVTEMDNVMFSCLTLNPQPLHIDFHHAQEHSLYKKPLVNSLFTLGLMIGISVHDTTFGTTLANLGMSDVKFPNPVFHGDTINVVSEIVGKRISKSNPDAGIVEFEHRAYKHTGELVASCRRQAFMKLQHAAS